VDLTQQLHQILDIARLAPSVHNAQPWLVSTNEDVIIVDLDQQHTLTQGDPTGRQTIMSMGIFAEAIRIGVEAVGLKVISAELIDTQVFIKVSEAKESQSSKDAVELLQKRCSDRSIYKPTEVAPAVSKAITQAHVNHIQVYVITDKGLLQTIANLTAKGIRLALSSPDFRHELSQYLVEPWSKKKRGIAVQSLYIFPVLAWLEPWLMWLGIGLNMESNLEKQRWESASGVVAITAEGDMPQYWFAAGQTYLRASLAIEAAGLSQATSAAIVEASDFHEDIEKLLKTNQRILAMIRIGKGSQTRHYSPRVSVDELLTST
jgi:hypothetical protein